MPDHSNSHSDNTVKEGNNHFRLKTSFSSDIYAEKTHNKHQTLRLGQTGAEIAPNRIIVS